MRNIGTHVNNFWEVNSCCDFLVQSRRVLKPFQVEGSDNREFLHCQLLCALLVGVALATPDFGHGSKVFSLGEPIEAEVQGDGSPISNCW